MSPRSAAGASRWIRIICKPKGNAERHSPLVYSNGAITFSKILPDGAARCPPDALPGGLDVAAEFQRLLEILLDGGDAGGILHPDRILEVVVEAAVVEVYGAHHGLAVVHHKDLRVDEAGQPLADLHARVQQRLVVRLRQRIGELLIRHMGQDEVDVHAPLCRELEAVSSSPSRMR